MQKAAAKESDAFVLDLALEVLADMNYDGCERMLRRRGLIDESTKRATSSGTLEALRAEAKYADPAWLRGVVAEIILSEHIEHPYGDAKTVIAKAAGLWGVDRKAIEKAVLAEQKEAKPGKSKTKASPAPAEDLDDLEDEDAPAPKAKPPKAKAKRKRA